jgi:hypothetical protein
MRRCVPRRGSPRRDWYLAIAIHAAPHTAIAARAFRRVRGYDNPGVARRARSCPTPSSRRSIACACWPSKVVSSYTFARSYHSAIRPEVWMSLTYRPRRSARQGFRRFIAVNVAISDLATTSPVKRSLNAGRCIGLELPVRLDVRLEKCTFTVVFRRAIAYAFAAQGGSDVV